MQLQNRVALITGGGAGIGRAMATLFAREGAKVGILDRDRRAGEETLHAIDDDHGEAFYVEADVSRSSDVKRTIELTVSKYGRLDVLVNNAGLLIKGTVAELNEKDWDRVLAVNLTGAFLCSKYAIPVMAAHGGGVILNIASTAGLGAASHRAAYSASKGGLIALTRSMALDHAADRIRVNCLCPGPVDTPMLRGASTPKAIEEIGKSIPLGRVADPGEVALTALALVSDMSSYVTGAVLTVDGGETLT